MKDLTKPGEIRVIEHGPMPAIHANGAAINDRAAMRWTRLLVWFMRTMSILWIAKGLFAWTIVLGVDHAVADFVELSPVTRGIIGFAAVADLLAAVGLWLAAPWGGVLWLICAATEIMAPALGRQASITGTIGLVLDGVLIAIYFVLSWLAANERV